MLRVRMASPRGSAQPVERGDGIVGNAFAAQIPIASPIGSLGSSPDPEAHGSRMDSSTLRSAPRTR